MEAKALKRLTAGQAGFFETEGYLMVDGVFDPAELQPLREEIAAKIETIVRELTASGALDPADAFPDEGLDRRLVRIHERNPEAGERIMKALSANRGYRGPALFDVVVHEKLLDIIEDLVGPEIVCSSVCHIRPKLPKIDRGVVPWHQDSAIWQPHCDEELIVTCWLPLVNATLENGCLSIKPRSHRSGIATHYKDGFAGYFEIKEADLPPGGEPVVVQVPLGGALFFTNRTPHRSTFSYADTVRWSFDFRYQSLKTPNNIWQRPEDFSPERPREEIACHPPEADTLIRSTEHPEKLIDCFDRYMELRESFESGFDYGKAWYVDRWKSMKQAD